MQKVLKLLKKALIYTVLVVVCLEITLWILGFRPYVNVDYKVESNPNNAFVGDSLYGIQLNPGVYEITLNDSVEFMATHIETGQRLIPGKPDKDTTNLHFFGCSFTYGYGVDDDETFAAQTQATFSQLGVNNHAVIGYGTIQSLLQLKKAETVEKDDWIIMCFSSHHFMRNSLSQEYRSRLKIGFENSSKNLQKKMDRARFPMLESCGDSIRYVKWTEMYENWPGREYSASINFLQTTVDYYKDKQLDEVELALCIIQQMQLICEQKGANLAIACLDSDDKTAQLEQKLPETPWLNIGFDFENTNLTNFPYDNHPNETGHDFIHQKLTQFLENLLKK